MFWTYIWEGRLVQKQVRTVLLERPNHSEDMSTSFQRQWLTEAAHSLQLKAAPSRLREQAVPGVRWAQRLCADEKLRNGGFPFGAKERNPLNKNIEDPYSLLAPFWRLGSNWPESMVRCQTNQGFMPGGRGACMITHTFSLWGVFESQLIWS